MRAALTLMLAGGVAICAVTLAHAAETPREAYDRTLACAAGAAAARDDVQAGADAAAREKADKLVGFTRDAAIASGAYVGVAGPSVATQIEHGRGRELALLRQPDAPKAKTEHAELGRFLIDCALAQAMEPHPGAAAQRATAGP